MGYVALGFLGLSVLGSVAAVTRTGSLTLSALNFKGQVPLWVNKNGTPLHSCKDFAQEPTPSTPQEDKEMYKAWKPICDDPARAFLADTWIEPGFEKNFHNFYGADGWIDEAYVSYMSFTGPGSKTEDQILGLVKSIHANSDRPLVVVNYGDVPSTKLDPKIFPRLIVLHSHGLKSLSKPIAFNFNKFRAIMSSKIRTSVQLDADQIVYGKADRMFARTKEEITADYPYPMLPVHWMSKDDDPGPNGEFAKHPYDVYDFKCPKCAKRTARWGHAHPTQTFYALPFYSSTLIDVMNHRKLEDGQNLGVLEDEDALNVFLWEKGASKSWCKFDIPWVQDFNLFINGRGAENSQDWDPKWYPDGIPKVFYTAHHAYDYPETMDSLMNFAAHRSELMKQKPILFRHDNKDHTGGTERAEWFETGKELKAAYPDLHCTI